MVHRKSLYFFLTMAVVLVNACSNDSLPSTNNEASENHSFVPFTLRDETGAELSLISQTENVYNQENEKDSLLEEGDPNRVTGIEKSFSQKNVHLELEYSDPIFYEVWIRRSVIDPEDPSQEKVLSFEVCDLINPSPDNPFNCRTHETDDKPGSII